MNTFQLLLWDDEGSACTFYTTSWDIDEEDINSETDKFFNQFADPGHSFHDHSNQLARLITASIGEKYGAIDDFFDRSENLAQALPPKPKYHVVEIMDMGLNFPLRLYCYRVSRNIVILFNGGIKDVVTVQDSPSLKAKFSEAQIFVKKIQDALQSGLITISVDGRYIENKNGSKEIILY